MDTNILLNQSLQDVFLRTTDSGTDVHFIYVVLEVVLKISVEGSQVSPINTSEMLVL